MAAKAQEAGAGQSSNYSRTTVVPWAPLSVPMAVESGIQPGTVASLVATRPVVSGGADMQSRRKNGRVHLSFPVHDLLISW